MPILDNNGRIYTGAATRIVPPITAGDCTLSPSFEQLVDQEQQPGRACTIRAGKAWARRTTQQIAYACTNVPEITGYTPATRTTTGNHFYTKTGPAKLEYNVGAGWLTKATSSWNDTTIVHAPPPLVAGNRLRVTNKYGIMSNEYTI